MSTLSNSFIRDLEPRDLGLDGARFASFRDVQYEALEWTCEVLERGRFAALALPTGAGKSLYAAALMKLLGKRAVVLTATKALQEQYVSSFISAGMVDIRGKANYQCLDLANLDCKDGARAGCRYVKGSSASGCTYEVKKLCARNANSIVTNYDFWMAVNAVRGSSGLERTEKEASWKGENPVELLVLDEAHEAVDKLSSFVSCTLYESELLKRFEWGWPKSESMTEWMDFARVSLTLLEGELESAVQLGQAYGKLRDKKYVEEIHRLEALIAKFGKLVVADADDWICEQEVGGRYGRTWRFDPVFPGRYAEKYLFCGVEKVVLMSATLKPKTLGLLGVGREKFEYKSWRRIFPAHRQPVLVVSPRTDEGKSLGFNYKSKKEDYVRLVEWMDKEIIEPRLDRKGLIQTVSYDRAAMVLEMSKYKEFMVGNTSDPDSDSAWEVAEKFRAMKAPAILVSPSFSTGWDFPGEQVEFTVLMKVPIEPSKSKVMKARTARDKDYAMYKAMQTIEQSVGRGMRYEQDQVEVFCVDGRFNWFLYAYKHLAQDWFVAAVRKVDVVPRPLPKLKVK